MNTKVERNINGLAVSANPIFKGGAMPAYWNGVINERVLPKIFSSAAEVFRFARNMKGH